jgi:hypothetical protein
MKKLLFTPMLLASMFAMAQNSDDAAAKFASTITAKSLKEKLSVIASAEFEGRETATPGQKKAAAYIESLFKKFGLKPGNGDSYQQVYPVYQDELLGVKLSVNGKPFQLDKDFTFTVQSAASGVSNINEVVFLGYGLPEDFANIDVKGKVVLFLDGAPADYKPAANAPTRRGGPTAFFAKAGMARTKGAAGVVLVSNSFPRKVATATKGEMYLTKATSSFTTVTVSEEIASALLGRTSTLSIDKLKEVNKGTYYAETKLDVNKVTTNLESSNVIGILEGTDKKDEYVVLSGHYDHLGKRDTVIYYGADDDGSGTTSVLQMAEAFAAAKKKGNGPRRSIIFLAVSGEEKGLWGSQYYSEHPLYPLAKTSVDLNTDMVGRVDTERKTGDTTNYVYVIGHDKLSSDLPIINEGVNKQFTNLTLDYKYDDPNDKNQIYYRSDHYNFAKMGVPILFFYDGMLLADYHKPTDTVDKINFELMEKRVKMIFHTAWVMANRDQMLKRDIPLNMPSR